MSRLAWVLLALALVFELVFWMWWPAGLDRGRHGTPPNVPLISARR